MEQNTQQITGGCLCGAVRYRIAAAPIVARACWCRDCQYLSAGGGTVNVAFPAAALELQGVLSDFVGTADSGNIMHRRFCPNCGTQVLGSSEARPHLVMVRAGSLDDPELARPQAVIWTASAPSWACLDDTVPHVDRQPPPLPPPG